MSTSESECVVLVPSSRTFDAEAEAALQELSRRRYPVWRIKGEAPPDIRDRMATDALNAGFRELFFIDPSIVFDPDDADRLRNRGLPIACGAYPVPQCQSLSCDFFPGSKTVRFGEYGVPVVVRSARLGFALIRREVLEAIRARQTGSEAVRCFTPPEVESVTAPDEGAWFSERARAAGLKIVVDTSIRLWKVGPYRHGWEDAGSEVPRHEDYTYFLPNPGPAPVQFIAGDPELTAASPAPRPRPPFSPLRPLLATLPSGFPKLRAYVVTYPANRDSLALTLASFRATDWGEEPVIVDQPAEWKTGGDSAPANYKRALEAAAADACDYALILEDDTRFNRHLRKNILSLPIVQRDQCDYLSLFVPDLMADPWERTEPGLGYRLAKPRYGGPDRLWEKYRVWGVQAILMSHRLILAALERWDCFRGVQDARLMGTCGELGLPLYYSAPCWVEHAPLRSGYNTPLAYAPDFDPDFQLEIAGSFEPPECVPGWLTRAECELLFRIARDCRVLEVGSACGQATVSMAQSARSVTAVDSVGEAEAREWVARFGLASTVTWLRLAELRNHAGTCDLLVLSARDSHGLERDLAAALPHLETNALIAVQNYPDPAWPEVRTTLDAIAQTRRLRRIHQVDYLGVFQTGNFDRIP